MPEIPPQTVTEEQYTDEFGNMVVKKVNALTFSFSVSLRRFSPIRPYLPYIW